MDISSIFSLLSMSGEIKDALALWDKNKADNTRCFETAEKVLRTLGVLAQDKEPLKKYSAQWVQETLRMTIAPKLVISGNIHDDPTINAVKAFQAAHNLEPDGWVGAQTIAALEMERARLGR